MKQREYFKNERRKAREERLEDFKKERKEAREKQFKDFMLELGYKWSSEARVFYHSYLQPLEYVTAEHFYLKTK